MQSPASSPSRLKAVAVCLALAAAAPLLVFLLRLGWYFYLVMSAGLIAAWAASSRLLPRRGAVGLVVATSYVMPLALIWAIAFGQQSRRTLLATWEVTGRRDTGGEPEVVLTLRDHPGVVIGIYSADVAAYLRQVEPPIDLDLRVTADLGCTRGVSTIRIGELSTWRSSFSYAGSSGGMDWPWPDPWWCP